MLLWQIWEHIQQLPVVWAGLHGVEGQSEERRPSVADRLWLRVQVQQRCVEGPSHCKSTQDQPLVWHHWSVPCEGSASRLNRTPAHCSPCPASSLMLQTLWWRSVARQLRVTLIQFCEFVRDLICCEVGEMILTTLLLSGQSLIQRRSSLWWCTFCNAWNNWKKFFKILTLIHTWSWYLYSKFVSEVICEMIPPPWCCLVEVCRPKAQSVLDVYCMKQSAEFLQEWWIRLRYIFCSRINS